MNPIHTPEDVAPTTVEGCAEGHHSLVEYRQLQPSDVDAVTAFAIEGMKPDLYSGHLVQAKVRATVERFLEPGGFHLLAFEGRRVVGIIAAVVSEQLWFERCAAHVIACYATATGVGRTLIQALRAWADAQFMVRRVYFPMEFHARPSMARLLARYGFTRTQTVAAYEKV